MYSYADDIALLTENEQDMQSLIYIVQVWCENNRIEVNLNKTNILHVRAKRKPLSRFLFFFNKRHVPYTESYKYLGCYLNEYLDYKFTAQMQADPAGRALGSLITKMVKNKGFPYNMC